MKVMDGGWGEVHEKGGVIPLSPSSTKMASSFSSETRMAVVPEDLRALMKISLAITSSFFWSSPCTLELPARPVLVVSSG